MGLLSFLKSNPPTPCGNSEWHEQAFRIDDERVPEQIREAAMATYYSPDCQINFVYMNTIEGGEWWLFEGEEWLEAYWIR